ncbi:MAG TPA: ribosome small subunit-dependent GTPase A, partial [Legionellaceae bacterium]|nr:ribosome small subunit-dependent GTPase A [Legionellaceae bacterium]
SGVGKSSLIKRLLPMEARHIHTGEISAQSQFGCHTTSNSHFYHLPTGGALIDSPGVREFALDTLPPPVVASGFREFQSYLSQCKFRNCIHIDTPQCAIINAVKSHQITLKRYENYVKIVQSNNKI